MPVRGAGWLHKAWEISDDSKEKNMNRRLVPLVAVAMLSVMAMAVASGINISGTWVLDKEKSDQPTMGRGGPGGGGPGGGGPRGPVDVTLVIKQTDNELQ